MASSPDARSHHLQHRRQQYRHKQDVAARRQAEEAAGIHLPHEGDAAAGGHNGGGEAGALAWPGAAYFHHDWVKLFFPPTRVARQRNGPFVVRDYDVAKHHPRSCEASYTSDSAAASLRVGLGVPPTEFAPSSLRTTLLARSAMPVEAVDEDSMDASTCLGAGVPKGIAPSQDTYIFGDGRQVAVPSMAPSLFDLSAYGPMFECYWLSRGTFSVSPQSLAASVAAGGAPTNQRRHSSSNGGGAKRAPTAPSAGRAIAASRGAAVSGSTVANSNDAVKWNELHAPHYQSTAPYPTPAKPPRKHVMLRGVSHAEVGVQTVVCERHYKVASQSARLLLLQAEAIARASLLDVERVSIWGIRVEAALREKRLAMLADYGSPLVELCVVETTVRARIDQQFATERGYLRAQMARARTALWSRHDTAFAEGFRDAYCGFLPRKGDAGPGGAPSIDAAARDAGVAVSPRRERCDVVGDAVDCNGGVSTARDLPPE